MENRELRIEVLLEDVVRRRASDLHIQVGLPPMLRIDGALWRALAHWTKHRWSSSSLPFSTKTSSRC